MFKDLIDRDKFKAILLNYANVDTISQSAIDEMLDAHVTKKQHIFELFRGKLRIEKEIDSFASATEIQLVIEDLIKNELKDDKFFFAKSLLKSVHPKEFMDNTLDKPANMLDVSLGKGMKISKALTKLCLPEDAHHITTKHSMALQSLKGKGKIVVSIDPCDYITMSSNNSGWRSCHRLDGGEYRTGPISYLRDSSSVICYMESSSPCEFKLTPDGETYTHTNKSWRQIALVSPDLEFAILERQYPSTVKANSDAVSSIFEELFENYKKICYNIIKVPVEIMPELHSDYYNCKSDAEFKYHYNDILSEMFISGSLIKPEELEIKDVLDLKLPLKGSNVYCLRCGEPHYVQGSDTLICSDCDDIYY